MKRYRLFLLACIALPGCWWYLSREKMASVDPSVHNEPHSGPSFYIRQLIPGEAWLEDGTTQYFESPTSPKRVELQDNSINLDIHIGHKKGSKGITREIQFTIEPMGQNAIQINCPNTNIKVELEHHVEKAVNEAIRTYEPVRVPKNQWIEIFTNDSHNAAKWQLWWGDQPPQVSNQKINVTQ